MSANVSSVRWAVMWLAASVAGCAGIGATSPQAPAPPPAAAASSPRPPAGALPAFEEVVRGATREDGHLPVWRREDKVWFELAPAQLGQPLMFSINVAGAVGQRGLYASQMGRSWLVQWRRQGDRMQLVALNTAVRAPGDPALSRAVGEGYSESLLAAMPLASAPHPQRQSVLVDASFLLGDIAAYGSAIESAFRLSYTLDRANSQIERVHQSAQLTAVRVRQHHMVARIPVLPAPAAGAAAAAVPTPPTVLPDARSFFIDLVYNFLALPAEPMRPRLADPRLGHFTHAHTDLSRDLPVPPRVHYIARWRLDKADPQAERSAPRQPIVFWLDRNIPERYREAVRAGVLEWNRAFERIGFIGAIEVRQQSDEADWEALDARHASIRWYVGADAATARGPHHADPRTGEILDADIAIADLFARGARRFIVETPRASSEDRLAELTAAWRGEAAQGACHYAREVAAEAQFVWDLLAARGQLAPDGPQAEAFVQAVLKDVVMHEVGHALGLKHNFKASTTVSWARLGDAADTAERGISGSVMDYNAYNLAPAGQPQGAIVNTTLGPYDYWAIEYAYRPFAPEDEAQGLARIAARSGEPELAYADDFDAGGVGGFEGFDPLANRFDLGNDPLRYYERRLVLSQELWQRLQTRQPQPGEDPLRARRAMISGFGPLRVVAELAAKYVGGMVQVRDLPGPQARATYTPVAAHEQRRALTFLTRHLFSADNFRFRPEFLRRLPTDYLDRHVAGPVSVPELVRGVQSAVLDRLLGAGTATRVLEAPLYAKPGEPVLGLDEVYRTVQQAVWSELRTGGEISLLRRQLQREHLRRVSGLLTRGGTGWPADALSLQRRLARQLLGELDRALRRPGGSESLRAHLEDSRALLARSLQASLLRQP
ncbi:zinc-dependent metalloprotease [Caldimonas sp.]|uniref:zinc-dependent metalloprotease n=1 Tax=Caldimonas sp. TaxID=2838790 RepID=UPI00307FAD7E